MSLFQATDQNSDVLGHDDHQTSSSLPVCAEDPNLCPVKPTGAEGQHREGNTEESAASEEHDGRGTAMCKPGKREKATNPGEENTHSKPWKFVSRSSSPPQQERQRRLQLYTTQGEKLSNVHLSNPKVWQNIGFIRAGWAPSRLPFLPISQYWNLKANSRVVSTSVPSQGKDKSYEKVPCGVTCYMHNEGPWCEIQANNGTPQCLLGALPTNTQGPPGM